MPALYAEFVNLDTAVVTTPPKINESNLKPWWFGSDDFRVPEGCTYSQNTSPLIFRGVFPVVFSYPLATRARCPAGLLHCNHAKRLTNPWGNKGTINAPGEAWILWGSKKYDRKDPYKPQPSHHCFPGFGKRCWRSCKPLPGNGLVCANKQTKIYVYMHVYIYTWWFCLANWVILCYQTHQPKPKRT